ncbi:MAG: ATP-binding protein [Chloroflexi bacterium]|nr:ATP-binding protein [Chloroflexota bacterium]
MSQFDNPYHNGDPARTAVAPFAGRQGAMARVGALVSEARRSNGLLFTGWRSMGKTALLHAIAATMPDSFVGVIVSLQPNIPRDQTALLVTLAETITTALVDADFTLSRLSQLEPPGEDPRRWFEETFLPPTIGALHANRRLLLMIDDVDRLIMGVRGGTLPTDLFAYLSGLLTRTPSLHVILTIDEDYENDIPALAPLIGMNDVMRLDPLEPDDIRWLLTAPVATEYAFLDEAVRSSQALTGGFPALAQRLGYHLYERWSSAPELGTVRAQDVRAVQPALYLRCEDEHRALWERLTANEQIVLGAISGLHYDDPLRKASAESIQRWLLETDLPMDISTVQAALRGLVYRHLLLTTSEGVVVRAGLFMNWLLENAGARVRTRPPRMAANAPAERRERSQPPPEAQLPARGVSGRVLRLLAILLVLVIAANIVVYAIVTNRPTDDAPAGQVPTATFIQPAITPLF